jgi:hypothetical protein
MIVIIGHLPPEKTGEARQAIRTIVPETLKEPGCVLHAFSEDALEPRTIRIAENGKLGGAEGARCDAAPCRLESGIEGNRPARPRGDCVPPG